MKKNFIILFLLLIIPIKAFALIEVDITRGNLSPLPLAVSPLSIDENSKKSFEKIINKDSYYLTKTIVTDLIVLSSISAYTGYSPSP